ncbi:hypothetical protein [Parabacteroides bouchesdurhonensis]|uniref:hypothetical protein n=1 Tax=Parabacteroides bouchesdurhonensis TaxID=1936995 RepID=UPI000E495B0F|nr:hypothetical protein [Parabacteroides bouchesdurhonensis]RHJ91389.1 hypothetical protein DW095_10430 [Bacteroides sp. AM07-16]
MILNTYLSLTSFVKGWKGNTESPTFVLPAINLIHALPFNEYEYGLSLLRKSIGLHEQRMNIPLEKSKQMIPFFRDNRRMLVGPEMEIYIISLYESDKQPLRMPVTDAPLIKLSFDYEQLAEHCLLENLYLIRCKYDEKQMLDIFVQQMEREYDKFFYDDEHTGFTADSRFYSMLCNACMEVKNPSEKDEKEWNLALFRHPAEAEYGFIDGKLTPFSPVSIPPTCIKKVAMMDREKDILSFSALAGFLQKNGLAPEIYLDGLIED